MAQSTTKASIDTAARFAVMNHMAKNMPGSELRPLTQSDSGPLFAAINNPQPRETGPDSATHATQTPAEGQARVNLTIVLVGTR